MCCGFSRASTLTLKTLSALVDGFLHLLDCQSSAASPPDKMDAGRHGGPQCQCHRPAFNQLVMSVDCTSQQWAEAFWTSLDKLLSEWYWIELGTKPANILKHILLCCNMWYSCQKSKHWSLMFTLLWFIILFISDPLWHFYLQFRLFKIVTDTVKEFKKQLPCRRLWGKNTHKFFCCNCFNWNSIHFNVCHLGLP